ncbi:transglycosylase SLT domain-containing protein [Pseudomonas panipatensis]|uniref:Soluble lytic murein transglycosylase n=1 Tax=Pseudomonas panipatensis TaxID=428992 RepID=A0A1G8FRI7_9PSED|nr:transglycosylase SLT domain-containing protein [Pseudomonas panipatensis]SDH84711.1 soluble lytic murein transglycosylase [Pseudomonas panipatensis]SMP52498.1 soluble lytic murein transglycosylase [Pseudomonas panipatensis]
MSIVSLPTTLNAARTQQGNPQARLEAASEQFEALFLQQILKQMRKAGDVLSAGGLLRSRDLDTMRDFYDSALADNLAQRKQTGIADLLVRQLSGHASESQGEALAGGDARGMPRSLQQAVAADWQRGVQAVSRVWQRGSTAFGQLVDSLIDHESAGDVAAVSQRGARGLMQLMPDTAKEMAAKLGLDFDEQRLTSDGEYNKRLGSAYLDELLQRYDGHRALALAAYNAGPGRVDEWLKSNGDPRTGEIGSDAWVQRIPFEETRNYTRGILDDLARRPRSVSEQPTAQQQVEPALDAGERLSLAPALNPQGDSVAYQGHSPDVPPVARHQALSAAFAQPIRLEPRGKQS